MFSASSDTVYENTCAASYTWPVNGITYFSDGIYTDTLQSVHHCDSIITLHLAMFSASSDTVYESTCAASYTWPVNGVTYFSDGIYTDTLQSVHHCDSIITLHLRFNSVEVSVSLEGNTLTALADDALYQWLDCAKNYAAIPTGANGQTFNPTQSGSYAVQIIQNGCTDTSACVAVNLVGIAEQALHEGFELYPNPTTGSITIQSKNAADEFTLRLFTVQGQLLETRRANGKQAVQLEILPPAGMYFIEVMTDTGLKTTLKVIKQ